MGRSSEYEKHPRAAHPGSSSASSISLRSSLLWAAAIALLLVALGFYFHGKIGAEKALTALVMPVGAIWLLLGGWMAQHAVRREVKQMLLPAGLWTLLTLCGSGPTSGFCLRYLETREVVFVPETDPALDVLVVLGGGTREGPERSEVASSGDRVVYAAQLFIGGYARRLITTGQAMDGLMGPRSDPSKQTIEIWTALGIPNESIDSLGGYNTFQEIENLKRRMPEMKGQRVGILTSAFHLPRAMRLARAAGLDDLIPVAANHRANYQSLSFTAYLPSAEGLAEFSRCQREFMARLISR